VFDLIAFILFAVMACRIVAAVKRESATFAEFRQSSAVAYTAFLSRWACSACYVPGLVLARKLTAGFDRAGTDRAWDFFAGQQIPRNSRSCGHGPAY
jgi:hypothetical protein